MKNMFARLMPRRKPETRTDPDQAAIEAAYAERIEQVRGLFLASLDEISAPVHAA